MKMVCDMDGMVEENGNHETDPLEPGPKGIAVTCVQSVIQPNQQSVIQTATGSLQPTVLTKGNVILVSKPNSVIQTPQGSLQTLQVVVEARGAGDEDSLSPRDTNHKVKRHHELLVAGSPRRTTKQLLDDGLQAATADIFPKVESSGSDDCEDSNIDGDLLAHSISVAGGHHYQSVLSNEASHLHLASQSKDVQALPTITMTTAGASAGAGTILHYAGQDGQFFVPGEIVVMQNATAGSGAGSDSSGGGGSGVPEDQAKKREIRLLKNREAARECRRKKKEYIKCLENRVAVLEAQNKALIDELKSLKELYCSQKTE